jgi:hypothetical protein
MSQAIPIEERLVQHLRDLVGPVPVGAIVKDISDHRELLSILEAFLVSALREVHAEWQYESLDGILPECMRKTGERQVELTGLGILISDQTLAPLWIQLRFAPTGGEIDWFDCRLGERGREGLVRMPHRMLGRGKLAVADRVGDIKWFYRVGFGNFDASSENAPN